MRWARLGLPVLFLLAFGLRVYRLDFQSIWTDEGFVIGLASRTLPELVAVWNISPQEAYASLSRLGVDLVGLAAETDIHPPLYYFLVHFWLPLAGKSEFALRFPAVFFGMLIIPVLYVLGKRLAGAKAATIAGAIAALSPFYLDFSQQVRMYTLVTFLAVLSMYSFQRAFGDGRRGWWVVYALSVALALYTHYFAITIVLVQAVLVVVGIIGVRVRFTESEGTNGIRSAMGSSPGSSLGGQGRPPPRGSARLSTLDSRLWLWLASLAGAVLLLAPWVPYALRQVFEYQNRSLLSPDWQTVLPRTWQTFNLGLAVDNSRVAPLLLAMLATLLAGLAVAWWRGGEERPGLVALSLYLVLPLLAGLAIFQLKPMFHPKYFMMASPAYYLLLGTAVWSLWRAVPWAALPAGLLIFASLAYSAQSYFFDARYWKDDTRAVARYLEGRATDRDLVLSDLAEPLGYYYDGQAAAYYLPGDESTVPQRLASIARDVERVFLVHYEHSYTDGQGLIPFLLEREGDRLGESGFRGYTLREYGLRSGSSFALPSGFAGPAVLLEDKLALEGWQLGGPSKNQLARPSVPSGGDLWAILAWRVWASSAGDYKASLSLVDGRGHLAAQGDSIILRGMDPTSRWAPGEAARNYHILPVYPGVPPGEYSLRLRVYGTAPPGPPGAPPSGIRYLGDEVELGKFAVARPDSPVGFGAQDMGTPGRVPLGPIEGLGYTLPKRSYQPGETLALTLFLKASDDVDRDYRFRFELRDGQGVARWEWDSAPLYPTGQWRKGDAIRDWQDLPVSSRVPPGEYRLWMGVLPPAGEARDLPWDLGPVQVLDRPRLYAPPPISRPLKAELDGRVALLGYDLEGDLIPGGTLRLILYWQALRAMEESYTVFAHLLDRQNRIWAQHDGIPAGDSPTSGWVQGEVVVDRHNLKVRDDAPPGEYTLEVGMYEPRSGRRPAVSAAEARVVEQAIWLQPVQVR